MGFCGIDIPEKGVDFYLLGPRQRILELYALWKTTATSEAYQFLGHK
jgi:hypothetical protein